MTPIIDLHCDTILALHKKGEEVHLDKNSLHIDIEKLRQGGVAAQFFAVFVKLEEHPDPWAAFQQISDRLFEELGCNPGEIALVSSFPEMEDASRSGKISAFLTIEEGEVVAGDPRRLEEAYSRGVRLVTLTWNYENSLGFPNFQLTHRERGLKPEGKEMVERMNDLGMLIDVSHLSDAGFNDVAELSKQPFIASHSNAREQCDHYRNLTDGMIRKIADSGGVVGLNFCPAFLNGTESASLDDMTRHMLHIRDVGGAEVTAFGSDFDGIHGELGIPHAGEYQKFIVALGRAGFTERELELAAHGNTRRVIRDVIG
jgi:membrane dipeptidase